MMSLEVVSSTYILGASRCRDHVSTVGSVAYDPCW